MKIVRRLRDIRFGVSRYSFLLQHYRQGNVLDIGNIGGVYGKADHNYSSHLRFVEDATGSTVYGFDLFRPEQGAELYANQQYGDINEGLPYEDGFFDTVYMGEIIEHLQDFRTVLSEVRRVLKQGGILIVDTPNAYSIRKFIKWIVYGVEDMGDPTHTVLFTPASVTTILECNGFCVDVLAEKHGRLYLPYVSRGLGSHLLVKATRS